MSADDVEQKTATDMYIAWWLSFFVFNILPTINNWEHYIHFEWTALPQYKRRLYNMAVQWGAIG